MNRKITFYALTSLFAAFLFQTGNMGMNVLFLHIILSFILFSKSRKPGSNSYVLFLWGISSVLVLQQLIYPSFVSLFTYSILLFYQHFRISHPTGRFSSAILHTFVSFVGGIPVEISKIQHTEKKGNHATGEKAKWIVISLGFLIVFSNIYLFANPALRQSILNLDINWPQITFFVSLFIFLVFLFPIFYPQEFPDLHLADHLPNTYPFISIVPDSIPEKTAEKFGRYLLIALTILLSGMNSLDLYYLFSHTLPEGLSYSEFLHQGFYALLFSIGCSWILILIFFRPKNGQLIITPGLRGAAIAWILSNFLLLLTLCWKNEIYIAEYGITLKRLWIYILAIATAAGCLLALLKLFRHWSNIAFIERGILSGLLILALLGGMPLGRCITWYNLKTGKMEDAAYLLQFLPENYDLLAGYAQEHPDFESEFTSYMNQYPEEIPQKVAFWEDNLLHHYVYEFTQQNSVVYEN